MTSPRLFKSPFFLPPRQRRKQSPWCNRVGVDLNPAGECWNSSQGLVNPKTEIGHESAQRFTKKDGPDLTSRMAVSFFPCRCALAPLAALFAIFCGNSISEFG